MQTTRLEQACEVLGWKGGTIHQANHRLSIILNQRLDILTLKDEEWNRVYKALQVYREFNNRMNRYGL